MKKISFERFRINGTRIQNLLTDRLFLCALAGNFILCILSVIAVPAAYSATQQRMDLQRPVLILLLAAGVIAALLLLSAMGYFANRSRTSSFIKDFPAHLRDSAKFAIFFICSAVLYALLCGLLAAILYAILKGTARYETIKHTVNLLTFATTLMITPVMLMEMLSFAMSSLPVRDTIRAGLAALRMGYGRMLLITAIFFLTGGAFSLLIPVIHNSFMQSALSLAAYTLLGGAGTYAVYRTGMDIYRRPPEKPARKHSRTIPLGFTPVFGEKEAER